VTKLAPHKALKLIAQDKLTFDESVVLHRVAGDKPHVMVDLIDFTRSRPSGQSSRHLETSLLDRILYLKSTG